MKRMLLAGMMLALVGCESVGTAKDGSEYAIESSALKLHQAIETGGYQVVSTDELKQWMDEGVEMLVVDTMPSGFYDSSHLPNAANYEMKSSEAQDISAERLAGLKQVLGADKDKRIVIYCGYTACGRSHAGTVAAKRLGYENLYRYPGGIIAWKDAGYPVEKTQ